MEAKAYCSLWHQCNIPRSKLSQAHGSDAKRVKIAAKPQKNGKESCQKRQVEQRKHYLSLARKSFKNRENIKRKREAGHIRRKRELIPAKTEELKSCEISEQLSTWLNLSWKKRKQKLHGLYLQLLSCRMKLP